MGADLDEMEPFDDDGSVRVVVEATKGRRSKLKYEPSLHAFALHHVIPGGAAFPLDFGFVPGTRGQDGDPLDVLVFADEPTPVGAVVPARLIGVIEATQQPQGKEATRNDRILAVARTSDTYGDWNALEDVPEPIVRGIESFFESYNAQRDVKFTILGRSGRERALQLICEGQQARRKQAHTPVHEQS
jgi:inorganic pyrophosphatase